MRTRLVALVSETAWQHAQIRLRAALPVLVPTLMLSWLSVRAVLEKTGGVPAMPLDDSYIHFQFARSIADGAPLHYSPGCGAVGGATSLLWPTLLSVGYLLGLRGHSLVWEAWLLGFTALGLLAHEARRATEGLVRPGNAVGAGLLILCFSANTWFAASGMEVVPLAWLMLRGVRRAAEWCELSADDDEIGRRRLELVLLSAAAPLMRPEGALISMLIALALGLAPRRRSRAFALFALCAPLLPALLNRALTGDFASTTARSKWLLLNPYSTPASVYEALRSHAILLVSTLLNGEVWSALFLPRGSAPLLLAALAALSWAGYRRDRLPRALLLTALGLGILFPGSYDCPLCNRLRYLWPFFPAWLVGAAVLADLVGAEFARASKEFVHAGRVALGAMAGALLGYLPFALDDLGTSAAAIFRQQVSLGVWAESELPRAARIGVNDTGAIAYFSGRTTFDVVGLTTAGEARYWTAGSGSRFEHYERLGKARLPTHYIVYPEWFALEDLLGAELTERYVPGASILGGSRMVAYEADYSRLGSGEKPGTVDARPLVDSLDVADLESEQAHAYELDNATQRQNFVVRDAERLDGARSERTRDRFRMQFRQGGALIIRAGTSLPSELRVRIGEHELSQAWPSSAWHEALLALPPEVGSGLASVEVRASYGTFTSLHYYSLGPG